MTTHDDKEQEKESGESPADRLEEIKKEETEDASSYYSQGEEKDSHSEAEEFAKPVPEVDKDKEEMNLLKALAYLGFALGALAIIFILFFIRDLDGRVAHMGDKVVSMGDNVDTLEQQFAPLKKEVEEKINKVSSEILDLKGRVGDYERSMTVMELKRALVAIKAMAKTGPQQMKSKSSEVVASIQALLRDLGEGPAGEIRVEEAPLPSETSAAIEPESAPVEGIEEALEEVVEEPAPPAAEEAVEEATEEPSESEETLAETQVTSDEESEGETEESADINEMVEEDEEEEE